MQLQKILILSLINSVILGILVVLWRKFYRWFSDDYDRDEDERHQAIIQNAERNKVIQSNKNIGNDGQMEA